MGLLDAVMDWWEEYHQGSFDFESIPYVGYCPTVGKNVGWCEGPCEECKYKE